ncbi:MAG: IS110 family transposase [Actinomycetota bacterium]
MLTGRRGRVKGDRRLAGIDWASNVHAVCVLEQDGGVRARFDVPNTGKSFDGLVKRLGKLGVADVAIERPDGPLVEALLEAGVRVFVVAPRMLKALRQRYGATGAKSDPGDAYVLADVLRTDGHRLKALIADSAETKVLRALTRTRKDLVEARVALENQLRAQLEVCFPGAIGLFHELSSAVSIAFLRRYPTTRSAQRLTEARLAAFLHRIGYCGRKPVAELLARVKEAPEAGITEAEAEGRAICVAALVDAIELSNAKARELQAEVVERLETHRDAAIFTSLPRAGRGVRAASLLAEIGDARERFPDEECLAALAGVAPVTKASGKSRSVGFRWACDKKLRNALIDFVDDSRHASPWAARIYTNAIARGKRHPHAIRILARAWVRVIWRMWQDGKPYDVSKHGGAAMLQAA